jgi:Xaa-Pro aminopeptidase
MSAARADRLVERLRERELDSLLVTDLVNVRYLSGFTGTNGLCVVGPDIRLFLTDFRYVERAQAEVSDFERARGKQDLLADAAQRLSGRVGFEDQHMSVRQHERLRGLVPEGVELVPAGGIVEGLRAVKDAGELRAMRDAAALADAMYEYV